jgi:hypothetical protein
MREEYDIVEDRRNINNKLFSEKTLLRAGMYTLAFMLICWIFFNIVYLYTAEIMAKKEQKEVVEKVNKGEIMGKTYQIEQKLRKDLEERNVK